MHFAQRFIALGMALGLLLSDPAMEWLHHDMIPGTSNAGPAVSTHTCGSRERHVPADRIHPCGICLQRLGHFATGTTVVPINNASWCASIVPLADCENRPCMSYLRREQRGPPTL